MSDPSRVLIVGASAAGLATAEALRRDGYDRELTIVGDEPHLPYDRPPLSKRVLDGSWEPSRTTLRRREQLDRLEANWRLGATATGVDIHARRVRLGSGEELPYDDLVIATGVTARRLPFGNDLAGVHVLRTVEDAAGLRIDLLAGGPLVVIGAGPLGCETAATARSMGVEATVVDVLDLPMERQVGPEVAQRLQALHVAHGVRFHLGVGVSALHGADGRVAAVELVDGTRLEAATVLVAIGAAPAIGWLEGSGIPVGNGVVCDQYCRAMDGVYAAGDVAEWFNPRLGERTRLEHRMNANEQGVAVATNLLGRPTPFAPIPYFWSDQYDVKLQAHGRLSPDADVRFESHADDDSRFGAIYSLDGIPRGVLGWNAHKQMRAYRDLVGASYGAVAA